MATPETTSDFGRYLQAHRRSKEMPLEVVAQRTKVRVVVLQYIENEELDKLPTPTLTKGFIKVFAEAVGADPHEALQRYGAGLAVQLRMEQTQAPQTAANPFWRRFLPAVFLLGALIAVTLFLVERFNHPTPTAPEQSPQVVVKPVPAVEEKKILPRTEQDKVSSELPRSGQAGAAPEAERSGYVQTLPVHAPQGEVPTSLPGKASVPSGSANAVTVTPPAPAASIAPPSVEKLILQVNAVELTWLKISKDDGEFKEMMLRPDEKVNFEAQVKFEMRIGNAAGIQLTLNGQPVPIPGGSGKVVSLKLP